MPSLQKPSDPSGGQFESQCLIIFEHHFDAKDANFYGRSGVEQNGVDITLTTHKEGRREKVVIQCKDRHELHWSDFSSDFRQALITFAPRAESDPDLFYILATTVLRENTADILKKIGLAKEQLSKENPSLDLNRVKHEVFGWERIQLIVAAKPRLQEIFCDTPRAADCSSSKQLNDLVRSIAQAKTTMNLRFARDALAIYRSRKPPVDQDDYQWVPTAMMSDLLDIFLRAGDFEQADKLLDAALGADPLRAGYLLAHLRTRRVLGVFRTENRPLEWLAMIAQSQRSVAAEVDFCAADLIKATSNNRTLP
jgi:tetratricopeptide (TPR) repeat protein